MMHVLEQMQYRFVVIYQTLRIYLSLLTPGRGCIRWRCTWSWSSWPGPADGRSPLLSLPGQLIVSLYLPGKIKQCQMVNLMPSLSLTSHTSYTVWIFDRLGHVFYLAKALLLHFLVQNIAAMLAFENLDPKFGCSVLTNKRKKTHLWVHEKHLEDDDYDGQDGYGYHGHRHPYVIQEDLNHQRKNDDNDD